jgi:endo-1,4-beta-xylanase
MHGCKQRQWERFHTQESGFTHWSPSISEEEHMNSPPKPRRARWLPGLLVVPIAAVAGALGPAAPASADHTLRHSAGNDLLVGAAVTPQWLGNSTYANLAATEFSSLTAENHMKWETLQPSPGSFNFGPADQIVAFAQQHGQDVYGHTLVWHSQTPQWVQQLSGSALEQAMEGHITTVMQHFAGSVQRWDVVNEAIEGDGSLRNSFWLQGMGPGYIASALQYARAADPSATLCLNDFSIDGINAKSDAYFQLVQQLLADGVPIDCMGFQAHLILGQVPSTMQQNLQRFADLGLEVWITELDIRMNTPPTQQMLEQQATEYAQVFEICQNVSGCAGVTTWGIHDGQSWIPDFFPGQGAALMWDENFQPKPAYFAVLEQLGGDPGAPPPPPPPPPPGDCQVTYQADNWGGHPGFTATVTITNTSASTINGWTLVWDYPAGQTVDPPGWNATVSQSGATVTAVDAPWTATVNPGQSTSFGFNGLATAIGSNPPPTAFSLNGTPCTVS